MEEKEVKNDKDIKKTGDDCEPAIGRFERAELETMLAKKQCVYCATRGRWKVYKTDGRIRYCKCLACGSSDKVIVKEQKQDEEKQKKAR